MCTETNEKLDRMTRDMQYVGSYIASIQSQLKISSNETHDYSEVMAFGGPQGLYKIKAPWNECTNVQFKVDTVASGGTASCNFLISGEQLTVNPGFISTDIATGELSPIHGLVLFLPSQVGTLSVSSCWYDMGNSSLTLYMNIITTASGYANIQFRKKR